MSAARGKERAVPVLRGLLRAVGVLLLLLLVVGMPAEFYRLGKLTFSEAFAVGSSLALAIFTAVLWQATAEQARATREMKRFQVRLASADLAPLLFIKAELIARDMNDPLFQDYRFRIVELSNLGRYGFVFHRIKWLIDGVELEGSYESRVPVAVKAGEVLARDLPEFDFIAEANRVRKALVANNQNPGFLLEVDYSYGGEPSRIERAVVPMIPFQPVKIVGDQPDESDEGPKTRFSSGWGIEGESYWAGVLSQGAKSG